MISVRFQSTGFELKKILLSLVVVSFLSTDPLYAQDEKEKMWDDLQEQAITYYQSKEHEKAVETQGRALKLAEEAFGPEDLKVAESMDNLAIYSQGIGDYAGAEKLYESALAIMEKKLPPSDHYLAIFMDYVAEFYGRIGKKDREKALRERAKAIRAMDHKEE